MIPVTVTKILGNLCLSYRLFERMNFGFGSRYASSTVGSQPPPITMNRLFSELDPNLQNTITQIQKKLDEDSKISSDINKLLTEVKNKNAEVEIRLEDADTKMKYFQQEVSGMAAEVLKVKTSLDASLRIAEHAYFNTQQFRTTSNIIPELPSAYFVEVVRKFEYRMKEYKRALHQIKETLDNSYHSRKDVSESLKEIIANQYNVFLSASTSVAVVKDSVEELKRQYMLYRRKYFNDKSDPFQPPKVDKSAPIVPQSLIPQTPSVPSTPAAPLPQFGFAGTGAGASSTAQFGFGSSSTGNQFGLSNTFGTPSSTTAAATPGGGGATFGFGTTGGTTLGGGGGFGTTGTTGTSTLGGFGTPAATPGGGTSFGFGTTGGTTLGGAPSTGGGFGFGNTGTTGTSGTTLGATGGGGFGFGSGTTGTTLGAPSTGGFGSGFGTTGSTTTGTTLGGGGGGFGATTGTSTGFGTPTTTGFGSSAAPATPSFGFGSSSTQPSTTPAFSFAATGL
eukprot:TRINITY_DN5794_c0_g2_i1.p1 TRINITY_DN5794_c0_g2~~TRINITY_DN5794_c0_g2_i1.p1  ORF type:complete len:506 (-),score=175.93 TRINITY_DN5794_c0_g2_i1:253-1770(-)